MDDNTNKPCIKTTEQCGKGFGSLQKILNKRTLTCSVRLFAFLVLMKIILCFLEKLWKSGTSLNKNLLQNIDIGIEDLLDLTDTEDSTSSSSHQVFEGHRPFVLELHELKKDDPANPLAEADKKKKKKKKTKMPTNRSTTSASSSSASDSSIPPAVADAVAKEQFYDAHESFHVLSETKPTAATTLGQSHSEHHTPSPKIMDALPPPPSSTQPSSAVSKQIPRPE